MSTSIKHVNFNINPLNVESQSKRLVRLLSELSVISFPNSPKEEAKIKIKKFTDGLSNILIGVYHQDNPEDIIMVRIYGEATSNLVDRSNELDAMVMLSSVGLSSKLYAKFENGFCYQYLNGTVLDTDLVRNERVSKLIARSIAKLHTLKLVPCPVPGHHNLKARGQQQESNVIKRMRRFLDLIPDDLVMKPINREKVINDLNNNQQKIMKGELLITKDGLITKSQLVKEVNYIERSHLIRTEKDIVFCHNDTLPKNLILTKDQKRVLIIDLEYADFNGRGYELADHFLEFCGIENFDPSKYPNENFIRTWIKNYVATIKRINVRNGTNHLVPDEVELYVKVQMYTCICNLFWSLWSLYMSRNKDSSIKDFDHKEYATKRLKDYYRRKCYLL